MALKAGIPAASRIPDSAQLFLGFTSSQRGALGPSVIANLETLPGLTDQWPDGYFRNGTTMHVSHLYLDLERWYGEFTFDDRVWATFRPRLDVPAGTQTVPQGPRRDRERRGDARRDRGAGIHRPLGGHAAGERGSQPTWSTTTATGIPVGRR